MNRRSRRNFLCGIAASISMLLTPAIFSSAAQASEEPIRIVVPYGAGGSTDTYARILAESMSQDLGRQVLVENKPGANGIIASTYVSRAKPDGTTLLIGGTGPVSLNPLLRPSLAYGVDSFEPVALLYSGSLTISVPSIIGVNSIEELVAHAKSSNTPIRFGTMGPGSVTNLFGIMMTDLLGIKSVGVAYKGVPASLIDLIAGQAELTFAAPNGLLEHQKAGDVKILALTTEERDPRFPNIPTVVELGYPELVVSYWGGFLAPKGTPKEIIDQIANAAVKAANSDKFKELIDKQGMRLTTGGSEVMAAQLDTDAQKWGTVIKQNNITIQ